MTAPAPVPALDSLVLCVDLDGTLLRGDTLLETVIELVRRKPGALFLFPCWLRHGRARFKQEVARRVAIDPRRWSFRTEVVEFVERERRRGRPLALATAADERIATAVAAHLGGFGEIFASDGNINLKGQRKAAALIRRFGARGYVYAGDSRADLPVWEQAAAAIVVGPRPRLEAEVAQRVPIEARLVSGRSIHPVAALLQLARPHQWIKNLLLFVPLLTAQRLGSGDAWLSCALAMIALSLVASAVYAVNDLVDAPVDRLHRRKRRRPLANGQLAPHAALRFAGGTLLVGASVAAALPAAFAGWLAVYAGVAISYTLWLKPLPIVDVVALALLYTLRLLLGAAAIGVPASAWLLSFATLLFGSLALLKRYVELTEAGCDRAQLVPGRGYRYGARGPIAVLGVAAGGLATAVIAAYVPSAEAAAYYRLPIWLAGLAPLVGLWIARAWRAALRGSIHDDPVVHALRDPVSYGVVAAMVLLTIVAR